MKTANEILFENGIRTIELNDDFNTAMLKSMEEYAEQKLKPYEDLITQIEGELEETENGNDVIVESVKGMIESFNSLTHTTEEEDKPMEFVTCEGCTCGKYEREKNIPLINACPIHEKNLYKKQILEHPLKAEELMPQP